MEEVPQPATEEWRESAFEGFHNASSEAQPSPLLEAPPGLVLSSPALRVQGLSAILDDLKGIDPTRIFLLRRASKGHGFGTTGADILKNHFTQFGAVSEVLELKESGGQTKRQVTLYFLVMESSVSVDLVFKQGETRKVNNVLVNLQRFKPKLRDIAERVRRLMTCQQGPDINDISIQEMQMATLAVMKAFDLQKTGTTTSQELRASACPFEPGAIYQEAESFQELATQALPRQEQASFVSEMRASACPFEPGATSSASDGVRSAPASENGAFPSAPPGLDALPDAVLHVSAPPGLDALPDAVLHVAANASPMLIVENSSVEATEAHCKSSYMNAYPKHVDLQHLSSMQSAKSYCETDGDDAISPQRIRTHSEDNRVWEKLLKHFNSAGDADPSCMFACSQLSALGLYSHEILMEHYSKYGEVNHVYVGHTKAKLLQGLEPRCCKVPGSIGIVVMATSQAVEQIVAEGERQEIVGHQIVVNPSLPCPGN